MGKTVGRIRTQVGADNDVLMGTSALFHKIQGKNWVDEEARS